MLFWVSPRRQIVVCRRFGTLCQFHLQRLDVEYVEYGVYFILHIQPLKMEMTEGSETSANHNLTPGRYPKEHLQYSRHGESLKSRIPFIPDSKVQSSNLDFKRLQYTTWKFCFQFFFSKTERFTAKCVYFKCFIFPSI